MTTAVAPTTAPTTAPTVSPVPAIPFAPAGLLDWQAREIVHSGELATAKALRLIGRGRCRVAGHVGDPVWVVSSASRPTGAHLVWVEAGRILCDCEARTVGHAFTCSHAQFVRLLIVAELADARSVPPVARVHVEPAPAVESAPVEPEPEPEPPAPAPAPKRRPRRRPPVAQPAAATSSDPTPAPTVGAGDPTGHDRQPCPTCGALADAAEIAELDECLNCLQMRADFERAEEEEKEETAADQLPCWCCGEPATAETDHGLYCDDCVKLSPSEQRRRARARLAAEKVAKTRAAVEQRAAQHQPEHQPQRTPTATAITAQQREAARQERARLIGRERARVAANIDPDRIGLYSRRPFSTRKADQDR